MSTGLRITLGIVLCGAVVGSAILVVAGRAVASAYEGHGFDGHLSPTEEHGR